MRVPGLITAARGVILLLLALASSSACSSSQVPADPDQTLVDGGGQGPAIDASPGSCDPVAQLGCGPAEKCTLTRGEARSLRCVPAGDREPGQSCETSDESDDCVAGAYCDGSAGSAQCVALCSEDPDTCGPNAACALPLPSAGDSELRMCAASCDPVVQDCERTGFACYPSRHGPTCSVVGGGEVPKGQDLACSFANECEPGFACMGANGSWRCLEVCDPSAPSCDDGRTCNPVSGETWGVCISAS